MSLPRVPTRTFVPSEDKHTERTYGVKCRWHRVGQRGAFWWQQLLLMLLMLMLMLLFLLPSSPLWYN